MSVCLLPGKQNAHFLRSITPPSTACLPLPTFFTLPHKCVIRNLCFFFLYLSYSKKNLARYCHECTYVFM